MAFTEDSDPIEDLEIGINVKERKLIRSLLDDSNVKINEINIQHEYLDVTTACSNIPPQKIRSATIITVQFIKY
jgi:hypothetical protein